MQYNKSLKREEKLLFEWNLYVYLIVFLDR